MSTDPSPAAEVAFRRAEDAYRKFCDHATACGVCRNSAPDPESCPAAQLCSIGRLLRESWESAERFYNLSISHSCGA